MADLIDRGGCWNVQLIRQKFLPVDAELILKIPLPHVSRQDKLIWHYDKRGIYSVKSGYHVSFMMKLPENPSCSSGTQGGFKLMWSCCVPNKIKIFFWRAINNLLPSYETLYKRKILTESWSPRCKLACETTMHTLVQCCYAKKVWKLYFFGALWESPHSSFKELAMYKNNRDDFGLFMVTAWSIWSSRNNWMFGRRKCCPFLIYHRAVDLLHSYRSLQQLSSDQPPMGQNSSVQHWSPPDDPWSKMNVDAAANYDGGLVGLGAIIRNSRGEVMAAATWRYHFPDDVEFVEAVAIYEGLKMAKLMGLYPLIIESDSQNVISLITGKIAS